MTTHDVVNRPLALVRCPDGTKGECFFQKHASAGLTEQNLRVVIDSKRRQVLAVEGLQGLLSLVQAGVLEVHVRGSMIDRLDLCDRHLRQAKEAGVKILIDTDAHHTSHMEKMKYGILQARRAWLTKDDVLNTLPAATFSKTVKKRE